MFSSLFMAGRESDHFAKLTGRISRIFKKETHEIDSKILRSFAEERKFEEYKDLENVDLKTLMKDSLGLHIFRKFAARHFQEENVLFWCEVNHFNSGEYTTPTIGTALNYNGMLAIAELQELRANRLISKYIEQNSRMVNLLLLLFFAICLPLLITFCPYHLQELNISHALREEIIRKVKDDEIEAVFDKAQQEVSIKILVLVIISRYREISLG